MAHSDLAERLVAKALRNEVIVVAGAGVGLSAKCAEAGGVDAIVIYNSGRFRMAGIQNFPTVGLIDGEFRRALEQTGMSYSAEVEMIRLASERGLLTMPYVFDGAEAAAMVEAGADVIVAHLGLTRGGMVGASDRRSIESVAPVLEEICEATGAAGRFIPVLCHGGPIAEPADLEAILRLVPRVNGFVGASSIERLPTEAAIVDRVTRFRAIGRPGDETVPV